jgi:hypothetical protein
MHFISIVVPVCSPPFRVTSAGEEADQHGFIVLLAYSLSNLYNALYMGKSPSVNLATLKIIAALLNEIDPYFRRYFELYIIAKSQISAHRLLVFKIKYSG